MLLARLHIIFSVLGAAFCLSARCQIAPLPSPSQIASQSPKSPVELFRSLLAMKPAERESALKSYPPDKREAITAKLGEYDILPPDLRNLRLRYTQLHWQLLELMKLEPAGRSNLLAGISASDRPRIDEQLKRWDSLSTELRAEFLNYESAVATHLERQVAPPPPLPNQAPGRLIRLNQQLSKWDALSDHKKQEMCDLFQEFFGMDDKRRQQILDKVPDNDRLATEKTLQAFANLPTEQRERWMAYLRRMVNMPAAERQHLMESAALWQSMPAQEREVWQKYVGTLPPAPVLPPMPPGMAEQLGLTPPLPPPPAPPVPLRNPGVNRAVADGK